MTENNIISAEAAALALAEGGRLTLEGKLDEAIESFARVPREAGDPYVRAQLGWLLADFARFRIPEAADRVRALLSEYPEHPDVLAEASLVLPPDGDPFTAWECLRTLLASGTARPCDYYQLACVAASCGRLDMARTALLEALAREPEQWVSAVLDRDLAPVWTALAEPSEEEAHALLAPARDGVEQAALGSIGRIWINLSDVFELPDDLRGLLRRMPGTWDYELPVEAALLHPAAARRLHARWERLVRKRAAAFAKVRARAMCEVLERQHDYAREALARDNLLAARWHLCWLLRHEPECLPALLAEPAFAPLHALLREIAAALPDHPHVLDDSFRNIAEEELIEARRAADSPCELPGGLWVWRYAMLCHHVGDYDRALPLFIELCRRWPGDACGFGNLADCLEHRDRWEDAANVLAAAPQWYLATQHAAAHMQRIEARDASLPLLAPSPFRGQPDLGGLLPDFAL